MAFQHFLSKVMHLVTNPTTGAKAQAEVCFLHIMIDMKAR